MRSMERILRLESEASVACAFRIRFVGPSVSDAVLDTSLLVEEQQGKVAGVAGQVGFDYNGRRMEEW